MAKSNPLLTGLMALCSIFVAACTPVNPLTVSYNSSGGSGGGGGGGSPEAPDISAYLDRNTSWDSFGTMTQSLKCQVSAGYLSGAYLTITAITLIVPGGASIALNPVLPTFYENTGPGWTYQPGQSYTVQLNSQGTLYSSTLVVPGGATLPRFSAPGPITWLYTGNLDQVNVSQAFSPFSMTTVGPPASSGSVSTASSVNFPVAGPYFIDVQCVRTAAFPAFGPNATASSSFQATDRYTSNDTKP